MSKIKQAVILCAGIGTRLRPLTDTMPKPMAPILGKPMLLWNINQFKKYGVSDFKINLHYLPNVVKDYFGDGSRFGVNIEYSFEEKILGTAGSLNRFRSRLNDNFFLIYGDIISFVNYQKMAEKFFALKNPIGMQRVGRSDNYADADVAELDNEKKFIAVRLKPRSATYPDVYRMRGIFIFNKKILNYVEREGYSEIGKDLLPRLLTAGENFYGYECGEFSKGVDTIDKLKKVEEYIKQNDLIL